MHAALIMDGNRRWAKKHKLPVWEGHKAGKKTLTRLYKHWLKRKDVKYLTLYSLSLDNFKKRNFIERKFLYKLFKEGCKDLLNNRIAFDHKINVSFIGGWHLIPDKELKGLFKEVMEKTSKHKNKFLTFAVCYDGHDELIQATKKIIENKSKKINNKTIKSNLFTKKLPPVDLIIRTGGEKRLSGFLLWDASYAELFFTNTLFPDSIPSTFTKAIEEYKKRKRRFGK